MALNKTTPPLPPSSSPSCSTPSHTTLKSLYLPPPFLFSLICHRRRRRGVLSHPLLPVCVPAICFAWGFVVAVLPPAYKCLSAAKMRTGLEASSSKGAAFVPVVSTPPFFVRPRSHGKALHLGGFQNLSTKKRFFLCHHAPPMVAPPMFQRRVKFRLWDH